MHAFIVLAGAIGLSSMTIGKMVNLCHATTSQRFSLMSNPRHLKKVIAQYGLKDIQYRRKVCAHADWRTFAHRFPQVRSAFERYRDGKTTLKDCYLIAHILKNQMAANGMKVNFSALGQVSQGTVDDLVARMRKAGIRPYLLRNPGKR